MNEAGALRIRDEGLLHVIGVGALSLSVLKRYGRDYWSKIPGLYYSGDSAYVDEDGYYWFTGRADDIIKIAAGARPHRGHRRVQLRLAPTQDPQRKDHAACVAGRGPGLGSG